MAFQTSAVSLAAVATGEILHVDGVIKGSCGGQPAIRDARDLKGNLGYSGEMAETLDEVSRHGSRVPSSFPKSLVSRLVTPGNTEEDR